MIYEELYSEKDWDASKLFKEWSKRPKVESHHPKKVALLTSRLCYIFYTLTICWKF